jgi:serine/threonine protein phosphatase PrpC
MDRLLPPDIAAFDLKEHDRYLLCSDGLTNVLGDTDISDILLRETSCEETCLQLVSRANQAGGYDNVTVIVAEVQSIHPDDQSREAVVKKVSQMDAREAVRGADHF